MDQPKGPRQGSPNRRINQLRPDQVQRSSSLNDNRSQGAYPNNAQRRPQPPRPSAPNVSDQFRNPRTISNREQEAPDRLLRRTPELHTNPLYQPNRANPLPPQQPGAYRPQARPVVRRPEAEASGPRPASQAAAFNREDAARMAAAHARRRFNGQEADHGNGRPLSKRQNNALILSEPHELSAKPKKSKKVPRWILILLDLLIVAVIGLGAYFLLKPMLINQEQVRIRDDILEKLKANKNGQVQIEIDRNTGKMDNENIFEDGVDFVSPEDQQSDTVTLTYIGRLVIPKIQVNVPISDHCDYPSLRFGVCLHEDTPALSQDGQTAIFGHRFLTKGRDFYALNEVVEGDSFRIDSNVDGLSYHYVVKRQDIIPKSELDSRVWEWQTNPNTIPGNTVMLVTCHPLDFIQAQGPNAQRLLVIAEMTHTTPLQ